MNNYLPTEKRKSKFKYPSIYSPNGRYEKEQHFFRFDNGYGASIINEDSGELWELAMLRWEGGNWRIAYNTEITDDVIGYVTIEEANALLDKINELEE